MVRISILIIVLILALSIQTALVPHAHLLLCISITMLFLAYEKLSYICLTLGLFLISILIQTENMFLFILLPVFIMKSMDLLTRNVGANSQSIIRYILNIFFVILILELFLGGELFSAFLIALTHTLLFALLFRIIGWRLTRRNPYQLNFVIKDEWY